MEIHLDKNTKTVYKQLNNVYYYGELEDFKPSYDDYFLPRKSQQRYKVVWKSNDPLSYEHEEFYTEVDKENWLNYNNSDFSFIVNFYKRIYEIKNQHEQKLF